MCKTFENVLALSPLVMMAWLKLLVMMGGGGGGAESAPPFLCVKTIAKVIRLCTVLIFSSGSFEDNAIFHVIQ